MSIVDDEEARKARARQLREQIAELQSAEEEADPGGEARPHPPKPENPREFIHRKMSEFDREGDA
jgi:hypothetical protein